MQGMNLEAKLLKGSLIELYGLEIKPLTIGEIVDDIGYEKYIELLSLMLVNKNKILHMFDDKEAKMNVKNFDLFFLNDGLAEKLVEFFKFFLRNENVLLSKGLFNIAVINGEDKIVINRDNYDDFQGLFCKMYWVVGEDEPKYNPANAKASEFIKKLEEKKRKYAKTLQKYEKTLFDIISGVAWKSPNMNIFDIWDLTIYQLYDAYYRMEIIDEYDKVITGLYSGAIDQSKIEMKKYDWTKKINLKK